MKILFVSMHSIHTIRWIENLKDTNHELYWFDVTNRGRLNTLNNITQFTGWKKRKISTIKGEHTLYKKFPELHERVKHLFEVTESEALEKIILQIMPDVVHSFEMQSCSYPIIKAMNKFQNLKWIYSCWGSDLYFYKNFKNHKSKIGKVLERVNFLHTDCNRDYILAKGLGFNAKFLGVIPGGTGYDLEKIQKNKIPVNHRKIILVKGYQHKFGRAIIVLKALSELKEEIKEYQVIVFGSHIEVINYVKENKLNFKTFERNQLSQSELLVLMGKSKFFIGNSISDGMPNTFLEAIIMGAFPIQSNPGRVTEEIINDSNGLLINNPESVIEIKNLILDALSDEKRVQKANFINEKIALEKLNFDINRKKVIDIYELDIL